MAQPIIKNIPEEKPTKIRIIDSLWTFVVATAVLGPLALPLLWRNPKIGFWPKVAGTIAVLLLTYYLIKGTNHLFDQALEQL